MLLILPRPPADFADSAIGFSEIGSQQQQAALVLQIRVNRHAIRNMVFALCPCSSAQYLNHFKQVNCIAVPVLKGLSLLVVLSGAHVRNKRRAAAERLLPEGALTL